jgi:PKD repeat protein
MKAKLPLLTLLLLTLWGSLSQAQPLVNSSNFSLHSPDTLCADLNPFVRIPVSITYGGSSGINNRIHWDFGDGTHYLGKINEIPRYHYYPVAGIYRIKAFLQVEGVNYWVTAADSVDLVVQQGCATGQAPSLNLKVDTACAGLPVQFGDSLPGSFDHLSFRWDFGDGSGSGKGWGVEHTYAQPGVYPASLCIVDRNRSDTFCIQELIHVKSCSPMTAVSISGPDTLCPSRIRRLYQPQVRGGSGAFKYRWNVIGAGSSFYPRGDSLKETLDIYFTGTGSFALSLQVTDLQLGTSLQTSDTVFVRFSSQCPFSASIARYDSLVYFQSGYNATFFSAVEGGSTAYQYQWSTSGTQTGSSANFSPTFFSPGWKNVFLRVVDLGRSDTLWDTVSVRAVPGLGPYRKSVEQALNQTTLNDGRPCVGENVEIENISGLPRAGNYYTHLLYDMGDGQVFTHPGTMAFGSRRDTHVYNLPGIYTVKYCMFNPNHADSLCSEQQVYVSPSCELEIAVETTADDGGGNGTAQVRLLRGGGYISYDWDSSGTYAYTYGQNNLPAGTYHLYARNAQGQTDTITYRIPYDSSVFPGDCNHDQVANLQDLLPIGLKHGQWGPHRPGASLSWTAQRAPLWGDTLANGRDIRHVDTNGDGIISDDDTLAIQLNFGLTHNNLRTANAGPKLFYQMPPGPHSGGDSLRIPIHLATVDTPIINLYGLTFGITYDTALVKAGSAHFDFSNSWLGTKGSNLLTMYREDSTRGEVGVAFVRKDQMNVSGYGRICDIIVVVDDHIGKRNIPFRMGFQQPFAIDKAENEISIGWRNGETDLATGLGAGEIFSTRFQLGQSPEQLLLYHEVQLKGSLRLMNLQAQQLLSRELQPEGTTPLPTDQLAPGIYLLEVQVGQAVWRRKVALLR